MLSTPLMTERKTFNVYIDNVLLTQLDECKFLGINIDSKLRWKSQINETITKISKLIGVLYKKRNVATPECLKQIYFSLAYPNFLYCCIIWGEPIRLTLTT